MARKHTNGSGKLVPHKGMLATSVLSKPEFTQTHPVVAQAHEGRVADVQLIAYAGELLSQSRGFSSWSIQLRDFFGEALAEYLTETAYNWNKQLVTLASLSQKDARERFYGLAGEWRATRGVTSSLTDLVLHSAYQQIIGMGRDAVPFLLEELNRAPDHWFWALKSITGEDPVPENDRGNLKKMAQAWLDWGRGKGFC